MKATDSSGRPAIAGRFARPASMTATAAPYAIAAVAAMTAIAAMAAMAAMAAISAIGPSILQADTVTTFSSGAEGWVGPSGGGGATTLEGTGGNPGANLRTVFNDFGITFSNDSNGGFVFDLTTLDGVLLAIDLQVEQIDFFGSPVSRPWLVELRDTDLPEPGYPWTSVWFKFAEVSQSTVPGWTTFRVSVADPQATALPEGWGGYGAEDAVGNPILPPNRSFASVLAGVDEIAFTTFEPGFVFGFTDHTLRIDNVTLRGGFFDGRFESGDFSGWNPTP